MTIKHLVSAFKLHQQIITSLYLVQALPKADTAPSILKGLITNNGIDRLRNGNQFHGSMTSGSPRQQKTKPLAPRVGLHAPYLETEPGDPPFIWPFWQKLFFALLQ